MAKTEAALAAGQIKRILTGVYGNNKFSVKSKSYSGGDHVRVEYTDLVPAHFVEGLISMYEYGSFDSYNDIYVCNNVIRAIPQTKYHFVERSISEAFAKAIVGEILKRYSGILPSDTRVTSDMFGNFDVVSGDLHNGRAAGDPRSAYGIIRDYASSRCFIDGVMTQIAASSGSDPHCCNRYCKCLMGFNLKTRAEK